MQQESKERIEIIIKRLKKLSVDNQYIIASYIDELFREQQRDSIRADLIQNGKSSLNVSYFHGKKKGVIQK